ncbi:hypothetical protein HPP92_016177 [Vanilla planifolia]|uniref:Uncharacterized protein n=1 Tax=Vanilla planifolia TaxID=51239 RepID=A0A835QIN2_VANPL|nr:hypothetical protein HPP92_016778 [Vanilla planifolia]KAG0471631.1 hypothetical protein HPP92_016177 [Vanilla planifolia]
MLQEANNRPIRDPLNSIVESYGQQMLYVTTDWFPLLCVLGRLLGTNNAPVNSSQAAAPLYSYRRRYPDGENSTPKNG